jgi:hypothetical protein
LGFKSSLGNDMRSNISDDEVETDTNIKSKSYDLKEPESR